MVLTTGFVPLSLLPLALDVTANLLGKVMAISDAPPEELELSFQSSLATGVDKADENPLLW
jgi:hypothetical protein